MIGRSKKSAVEAFLKGYSRTPEEQIDPPQQLKGQTLLFNRTQIQSQSPTKVTAGEALGGVLLVDSGADGEVTISITAAVDRTDILVQASERQLITFSLRLPHVEGPEPAVGICLAGTASVRTVLTPVLRSHSDGRQLAASRMRGCMFDVKPWAFAEAATLSRRNNEAADLYLDIAFHAKDLVLSFTDFRIW